MEVLASKVWKRIKSLFCKDTSDWFFHSEYDLDELRKLLQNKFKPDYQKDHRAHSIAQGASEMFHRHHTIRSYSDFLGCYVISPDWIERETAKFYESVYREKLNDTR